MPRPQNVTHWLRESDDMFFACGAKHLAAQRADGASPTCQRCLRIWRKANRPPIGR